MHREHRRPELAFPRAVGQATSPAPALDPLGVEAGADQGHGGEAHQVPVGGPGPRERIVGEAGLDRQPVDLADVGQGRAAQGAELDPGGEPTAPPADVVAPAREAEEAREDLVTGRLGEQDHRAAGHQAEGEEAEEAAEALPEPAALEGGGTEVGVDVVAPGEVHAPGPSQDAGRWTKAENFAS